MIPGLPGLSIIWGVRHLKYPVRHAEIMEVSMRRVGSMWMVSRYPPGLGQRKVVPGKVKHESAQLRHCRFNASQILVGTHFTHLARIPYWIPIDPYSIFMPVSRTMSNRAYQTWSGGPIDVRFGDERPPPPRPERTTRRPWRLEGTGGHHVFATVWTRKTP